MSEKNLTEAEWKKFSKTHDWKDASFIKALAALDKAKTPEQELAALDELEKQADVLRKSAKGDKELAGYLDDVDKSLGKQRKLSELELKKAVKDAKDQSEGEEEESPALLTTKMVPLIRQVKKGEEMQALLANNGKEVAVMLSRRPISPSKRKLMAEYLDGGTPKYYPGICIFEENAYTFVLKTQAGGLAKKLKAALLKQVELRLKVRVRGEDPDDVDDDGEEVEDEGGEGQVEKTEAGSQQPGTIPEAPPRPSDPLKAQYDTRLAAMEPRVLAVLKAQTGDASKIRAVAEFVREKGAGGNYKAALAGMDSLDKLLESGGNAAAPTPTPTPVPSTAAADPGAAAFNARLAALMPQIKEAIAAATEASQDVKLKVSEAGVFARKKDFEQANTLLDDAEALIKAVLNPPDAKAPGDADDENEREEGEDEGEENGSDAEDEPPEDGRPRPAGGALTARLADGLERLALLADPKVESALARVLANLNSAIEAGDAGAALPQFARLEEVLEAAERRKAASSPIERNLVKYRTAHAEWLNAERLAASALQGFGKQLLAHPDIADSPNVAEIRQYVGTLPTLVPAFGAELGAMLRSIEEADDDAARVAAVAASQDKIRSYQEDLLGDSLLIDLEQFASQNFSGLGVLANLRTALGRLEAVIKI